MQVSEPTNQDIKTALDLANQRIAELERLEENHRQTKNRQSALYRIVEVANVLQDLSDFYSDLHQIITELITAPIYHFVLYEPTSATITYPYWVNTLNPTAHPSYDQPDFLQHILQTCSPYCYPSAKTEITSTKTSPTLHSPTNVTAWLGVPLIFKDRLSGAIVLQQYADDNVFSILDQELLTFLSPKIANALEKVKFLSEMRQRVVEISTINSVNQALTSHLNLDALVNLVGDTIQGIFDTQIIMIILYNRPQNQLYIPYFWQHEKKISLGNYPLNDDIVSHIIKSQQPIICHTVAEAKQFGGLLIGDEPIHAYLGIPVISGDEVIGVIGVQDSQQEYLFNQADIRLLSTITLSMGVAIENAQLFTEILKAKSDAEQAKMDAEAANKAKSTFLSNLSHELRTPLNAILGFAELMSLDSSIVDTQRENLEVITRSGEHLLALINDVLEMSKIEAGRATLNEQTFNLHNLLNTLEDMFCLRAANQGLTLTFESQADIPDYVRTDEGKLRQVLINLLGNSIKFTKQGYITLRVSHQNGLSGDDATIERWGKLPIGGPCLCFEVEDSGLGITSQELDTLFEPFIQSKNNHKSQEGTGLGLPISRKFVQLMGGDIVVESQVGQGSTFRFNVAINLGNLKDIETKPSLQRVIALAPNQSTYRILVVEDKWENRKLLLKLLHPLGFEVQEAVNGQEAVDIWQSWRPHLIWMDMRMPVMDGYEATQLIKRELKGQATTIIALTASAFDEEIRGVMAVGCDDFLRKPFREAEIFEKMSHHLGIEFIYEEATTTQARSLNRDTSKSTIDKLTCTDLENLPKLWLQNLHHATLHVDLEELAALLKQIEKEQPVIANSLTRLVAAFRFDKILALTQPLITD